MLGIPALVPAAVAAYAVVGERQQGTLEPVLTTPIRREEFLLGKALAALVPSVAIAYAVYAFFLACVELFAPPAVASALLRGPDLLAQLLFTPLLAGWSIWIGIADLHPSERLPGRTAARHPREPPTAVVAALIAFNVIHATLGLASASRRRCCSATDSAGGSRQRPSTANDSSPDQVMRLRCPTALSARMAGLTEAQRTGVPWVG